jgi:hypothetical protein
MTDGIQRRDHVPEEQDSFDATYVTNFHGWWRPPVRSRVSIEVLVSGAVAPVPVEFGVGEPGSEVVVLRVTASRPSEKFTLPDIVDADSLLSVRLPGGVPVQRVLVRPDYEPAE